MGQIKNIKLHIVTDIKTYSSLSLNKQTWPMSIQTKNSGESLSPKKTKITTGTQRKTTMERRCPVPSCRCEWELQNACTWNSDSLIQSNSHLKKGTDRSQFAGFI